jgi:hypothetical protein
MTMNPGALPARDVTGNPPPLFQPSVQTRDGADGHLRIDSQLYNRRRRAIASIHM